MKLFSTIYLQPKHVDEILRAYPSVEFLVDPTRVVEPAGRDLLLYDLNGAAAAEPPARPASRIDPFAATTLDLLRQADVLFGRLDLRIPRPVHNFAPRLRWIQTINAGVGPTYSDLGLEESGILVTTSSGAFSDLLAEFALAATLAARKGLLRLSQTRRERVWNPQPSRTLANAQLCVVGTGSIGQAVARTFAPLCANIVGVSRSGRPRTNAPFERTYDVGHLLDAVRSADVVVVTLPATPATRNLLDGELFDAMKPGSYLVNVGRGGVIEEEALIRALTNGQLAGAALDVVAEEPLPATSQLWDAPNLLLSYHSTALVPGLAIDRIVKIFCDNLRRYSAGETLENIFDPESGY